MTNQLQKINKKIISCKKCTRLARYIRHIAKTKVKRFNDQRYWGRPLSGFGDPKARLLLIGLAPAAHGGNRTGRMFTGDSSGDWLARALYETGFSTKPTSQNITDGFELLDAYVTAAVRCAPPKNKPLNEELANCSSYLKEELRVLNNVKVIICLGKIAYDSCCKLLHIKGIKFAHGESFRHQNYIIICSYHPSRQNTQTGRLTWSRWLDIFLKARKILSD